MMSTNGFFYEKTILIAGGSGSWGKELVKQLLPQFPKKIIVFSRGELAQVNMERSYVDYDSKQRLQFIIGDIRDKMAVDQAMKGVDYVFHLAALKHVHICEANPIEATKTNVDGTAILISSADTHKVKKFIYVSTDKAVDPINHYGMTKGIGERLVTQANRYTKDTEFLCVRGGNVLGTSGSIVPLFIEQIKTRNEVSITDGEMTRYFMLLSKAIELLFYATEEGLGGEIYVINMPSFTVQDFADVLIDHYGDKNTKIKDIGARPGEKKHEALISQSEVPRTRKVNEKLLVVYPQMDIGRTNFHFWDHMDFGWSLVSISSIFTSETALKDKDYLKAMLDTGGFLE